MYRISGISSTIFGVVEHFRKPDILNILVERVPNILNVTSITREETLVQRLVARIDTVYTLLAKLLKLLYYT